MKITNVPNSIQNRVIESTKANAQQRAKNKYGKTEDSSGVFEKGRDAIPESLEREENTLASERSDASKELCGLKGGDAGRGRENSTAASLSASCPSDSSSRYGMSRSSVKSGQFYSGWLSLKFPFYCPNLLLLPTSSAY